MKILYVNHTSQISGGERSLLDVLRALPDTICPVIACPDGPLADVVSASGVQRVGIPGTDGSLKLHPRHTALALWRILEASVSLRSAVRRHPDAIVHANSIRAGLIAVASTRLGGPPTLVHVRDRLPPTRVAQLTLRLIGGADALIANSQYTAESLARARVRAPVSVLANPVDLGRFDPSAVDREVARASLGLESSDFVATLVAQITPWKGQEDAIHAIADVRRRHPSLKLLLVGSAKFASEATRYDNRTYLKKLHRLVETLELERHVEFLGEREDVPAILRASDALLVPSWEEPFGRSLVEAMAMEVPVVATTVGGPAEVITDGTDGLLVPPKQPAAWAEAISHLIQRPSLREELARNARLRSREFAADAHVGALIQLYEQVLEARARRMGSANPAQSHFAG